MSTPIYDQCLADFTARHGHAPGDFTEVPTKKAAPRKAAAKKATTRRKR